ncbi:flavin reductase (DIM6/NTAB) family NADH-FMN oxidoreductase RutF [Paraburkholderia sp. WSM4175]|uniref:flavin reductase family protein n=1 Tax=Paraburkholderia sp. WSM4175 TaxID=2991072 RepID=UPI003D24C7B5
MSHPQRSIGTGQQAEWDSLTGEALSASEFRRAMGRFASGVTVLSVSHAGGVRSMTVNAFMSVSLDPPLVVVSIARTAGFLAFLNSTDAGFGISFLSSKQLAECTHFGGKPSDTLDPRYDRYRNVPVLQNSLVQFAVKVHSTLDAGDHRLIVAQLQWMKSAEGKPLLFYGGKLGSHHWQEPVVTEMMLDFDSWG